MKRRQDRDEQYIGFLTDRSINKVSYFRIVPRGVMVYSARTSSGTSLVQQVKGIFASSDTEKPSLRQSVQKRWLQGRWTRSAKGTSSTQIAQETVVSKVETSQTWLFSGGRGSGGLEIEGSVVLPMLVEAQVEVVDPTGAGRYCSFTRSKTSNIHTTPGMKTSEIDREVVSWISCAKEDVVR